jgi:ribosomal protein S18 acetylase RimI-like enzyme
VNEPPGFIVASLAPEHRSRIAEILRSTENFREEEIDVALELFDESFTDEDYVFVGLGTGDWGRGSEYVSPPSPVASPQLLGFACYGPSMDTDRTYDLYWIAVDRAAHGTGCGSVLLSEVERRLEALHARMLVIETSSRSDYTATRGFYLKRGYVEAARVREFYAPEDDRIILTKRLAGSPREGWGAVA